MSMKKTGCRKLYPSKDKLKLYGFSFSLIQKHTRTCKIQSMKDIPCLFEDIAYFVLTAPNHSLVHYCIFQWSYNHFKLREFGFTVEAQFSELIQPRANSKVH